MKEELDCSGEATCSSSSFVGKKRSRSKSRMKMRMEDDVAKRSEPPRPCTECGKKFWSWKALFGHMRCHPERHWRGINPPPNARRQQPQPQPQPQLMIMTEEDHEVAACLLLLANGNRKDKEKEKEKEEVHHCSSCNKVFGSHQALGGHRASHKNVKGCFANANYIELESSEGHKCSICMRVFSTGQALGGHKRCHWDKGLDSSPKSFLDLNFPPPSDSDDPHPSLTLDLRLGL